MKNFRSIWRFVAVFGYPDGFSDDRVMMFMKSETQVLVCYVVMVLIYMLV